MKPCKKCKRAIDDKDIFCKYCGKRQKDRRMVYFLKKLFNKIFIGEDEDSLVIFMGYAVILGIVSIIMLIVYLLFLSLKNNIFIFLWPNFLYYLGYMLLIIFCIRCCFEIHHLIYKAKKNKENYQEYRNLLVNLFSGFMTLFSMIIGFLTLYLSLNLVV